jgi:hypothetical protein
MFHLDIFHFHNSFPEDGTVIYDIVLTVNKGPTYNGWFNIWQGYPPPRSPEKLNEYLVSNKSVNSVVCFTIQLMHYSHFKTHSL